MNENPDAKITKITLPGFTEVQPTERLTAELTENKKKSIGCSLADSIRHIKNSIIGVFNENKQNNSKR